MSAENDKQSIRKQESISDSEREVKHIDNASANVKLANPLAGIPHDQLMQDASVFAKTHGLGHLEEEFMKGALVAQDPTVFESLPQLNEEDKAILRRELTNRWAQPLQLYYLVIMCSLSAAVQGVRTSPEPPHSYHCSHINRLQMDESVINGANLFFPAQIGIPQDTSQNQWLLGLVNGAPYVRARKICGVVRYADMRATSFAAELSDAGSRRP